MKLAARLNRLETIHRASRKNISPYKETLEQDFRDWIENDPLATELIDKEFKYCISKGYPTNGKDTMDFYEHLDDPVLQKIGHETLAAFDKYLKTRMVI